MDETGGIDLDEPAGQPHQGQPDVQWHPPVFDAWFFGVAIVPIAPITIVALIWSEIEAEMTAPESLGLWVGGVTYVLYVLAWVVSRFTVERRFGFYADRVWLPPDVLRLRGRYVPYRDIRSIKRYGTGLRQIAIRFKGGTRRYRPSDVEKLTAMLDQRRIA